jgi:hypothetical protein
VVRVAAITGKDFVGKTLSVEHQPDNHLLAIGPGIARITALSLGIRKTQILAEKDGVRLWLLGANVE